MKLEKEEIARFQETIYNHYKKFGRQFSWRNTTNPYHIVVSEIMLQQTQTKRVEKKYEEFITTFPNFETLARAPLHDLLKAWQGLGYNRRALNLQKTAQIIVEEHNATLPSTQLHLFPGIGTATAASITAFAFNSSTVFVETNIRVVFFHFFFKDKEKISDAEILNLVEQTLDRENPRTWYYALMDYGAFLKSQGINPLNKSSHYKKQSKFHGSDRQIRGALLALVINKKRIKTRLAITTIARQLNTTQSRVSAILKDLLKENFMRQEGPLLLL